MCRGFQQNERERLKIKAFSTQLTASCSNSEPYLPDYLTLHYLPRINGSLMEINGSNIRPDSPAFVTLHRVLLKESSKGVIYASRERVAVCEGVRFAIYVGDVKVLKGTFRKDEGENWKMECELDDVVDGVKDAEVSVAAEGQAALMTQKVEMLEDRRRRRRRRRCCQLEEIPEETEDGEYGSDVCRCCECSGEEEMDGGDREVEVEMEMAGVRWAVDVGIWVMCIGVGTVGYLVSRASSSKRFRRKRFI
ncbi:hypothetical protein CDL12_20201 [Handroanthus impetiginosus]|uniref:Uncharacterized protein n=1 Tax=Handroanthus impetiginosus TaxID=429701 RepID=A0A2G9GPP0_9LAMI|nr:hypothetical protein CDL12_20201 [Handroanthus impetiginosus]